MLVSGRREVGTPCVKEGWRLTEVASVRLGLQSCRGETCSVQLAHALPARTLIAQQDALARRCAIQSVRSVFLHILLGTMDNRRCEPR